MQNNDNKYETDNYEEKYNALSEVFINFIEKIVKFSSITLYGLIGAAVGSFSGSYIEYFNSIFIPKEYLFSVKFLSSVLGAALGIIAARGGFKRISVERDLEIEKLKKHNKFEEEKNKIHLFNLQLDALFRILDKLPADATNPLKNDINSKIADLTKELDGLKYKEQS